jgi:hypothetical protein
MQITPLNVSRGSTVGIVTGYGFDDRGIGIPFRVAYRPEEDIYKQTPGPLVQKRITPTE